MTNGGDQGERPWFVVKGGISRGGKLSIEGGSVGSRGADSSGWGEDPRFGEVSGDVEDIDQQSGGDCWVGSERHGEDSPLVC